MKNEGYMSRKDVMAYLQISRMTLYRLMQQHAFPFIKLERKVLFRKSDIDRFMTSKLVK